MLGDGGVRENDVCGTNRVSFGSVRATGGGTPRPDKRRPNEGAVLSIRQFEGCRPLWPSGAVETQFENAGSYLARTVAAGVAWDLQLGG